MPHAQYLYDRCDELGMLVWVDAPFHRKPARRGGYDAAEARAHSDAVGDGRVADAYRRSSNRTACNSCRRSLPKTTTTPRW